MNESIMFHIVATLLAGVAIGIVEPPDAPKEVKDTTAAILRDELADQLKVLDLKGHASKTEETRIGPIVNRITFTGDASARFTDPTKNLTLGVTRLKRIGPANLVAILKASCPAAGRVHAAVEKGPSAGTPYTASATVEIEIEVTWETKAGANVYTPKVTDLKGNVDNLKFQDPIIDLLAGVAKDAANNWLKDSKNRSELRDKANAAIASAITKAPLRGTLDALVK